LKGTEFTAPLTCGFTLLGGRNIIISSAENNEEAHNKRYLHGGVP
jgi:hypothetical protein